MKIKQYFYSEKKMLGVLSFSHSSQGEGCRVGKAVMMCVWSAQSSRVELWVYTVQEERESLSHTRCWKVCEVQITEP